MFWSVLWIDIFFVNLQVVLMWLMVNYQHIIVDGQWMIDDGFELSLALRGVVRLTIVYILT